MDDYTWSLVRMFSQFLAVPLLWVLAWDFWKALSR